MRYRLLFLFLTITLTAKPTICLNMIVKDEKDVIERCLNSVRPIIDSWVIVDTGSTDGTQAIIRDALKDIPGQLFERPWKNWGETRTEALHLAQEHGEGDYLLFMDADDILQFTTEDFPLLTADLYYMWRGTESFTYRRPQLVKRELPCKYVGVTHEYLDMDVPFTSDTLETVKYLSLDGGATSKDPTAKFRKNVQLLEQGLKDEPNNERYAFYLAESYRDAGEPGKALEWYQKRIKMGGWAEETFWSMLQSAFLLRDLGLPSTIFTEALLHAHRHRLHRPEPIYYLAQSYMDQGNYAKAYEYLKIQPFIPQPPAKDSLFNLDWIAQYGLLFQLSICSYYLGHYEESVKACTDLLRCETLPPEWREQTAKNLVFPLEKLKQEKND
jgi:glycosyltransferase involved in cell wall biosynthesis